MLFNSFDFAIFLPIVFILYWYISKYSLKLQNALIIAASYLFYGWWDWRFLSLIIFSTLIDYFIGIALSKEDNNKKRKILLWISICVNLGFLGFFKYYNFFLDNFITAFSFFGYEFTGSSLSVILPVGISFYTFQTLSYTIDVYRNKLEPTKDIISFAAFICFFPQLVTGPIERATNLLPQFYKKRVFNYDKAVDGLRQILWGLFKKVVVADNCAMVANQVFNNSEFESGGSLVIGAIMFTFQIYCDFSGYSDIAIGTSKLFGFNLMENFRFPYFSRDIGEFWRRWHISLSTWFRDYLYIPLGGSKGGSFNKVRNTFIIFIVSGFWHGANWTFIFWGFLNALYFIPLLLLNRNRKNTELYSEAYFLPSLKEFFNILITFSLTVFAWIFFRAESLSQAFNIIGNIFSDSISTVTILKDYETIISFVFIFLLLMFEWMQRDKEFPFKYLFVNKSRFLRWSFYFFIIFLIIMFSGTNQSFIYFQF
jgi:D-alanyl-lipoteichoic acid acyltransferase DltB (MBOAT superfamily)